MQRHMQADHVGRFQQIVERHGFGADRFCGGGIARRRIEIADAAAHAMKGLRHRQADGAEADEADQQAVEPGEIVRHHAGAEGGVVAGLDFGIGPGEAPQQQRSVGDRVFGERAIAAAGDIGDRNADLGHGIAVEPVETGAGDLHQLDLAAFEQRGRKLGADRGNDERVARLHQLRHVGVVRLAVGDAQRRRRRRIHAGEIGLGPQAKDIGGHEALERLSGALRRTGSFRWWARCRASGRSTAAPAARRRCCG